MNFAPTSRGPFSPNRVNVADYGADLTGTRPFNLAHNAAITHLTAIGGGVLVYPFGRLRYSPAIGTLLAASDITILGEGRESELFVEDDAGDYSYIFKPAGDTDDLDNFHLRNIRVNQNAAGNTTCDVQVDGTRDSAQMILWVGGESTNVTAEGCHFDYCGINAFKLEGTSIEFQFNWWTFTMTTTTETVGGATGPTGYDTTGIYAGGHDIVVFRNDFLTTVVDLAGAPFEVHGANAICDSNKADGYLTCGYLVTPFVPADQEDATNASFSNNTFVRCGTGVSIIPSEYGAGGQYIRTIRVHSNTFDLTQVAHDMYYSYGVQVVTATGNPSADILSIKHNTVRFEADTRSASTLWPDNGFFGFTGISLERLGTTSKFTVESNEIYNAPSTGIAIGIYDDLSIVSNGILKLNTVVNAGRNSSFPDYLRRSFALTGVANDITLEGNTAWDEGDGGGGTLGVYSWWIAPKNATCDGVRYQRNVSRSVGSPELDIYFEDTHGIITTDTVGEEPLVQTDFVNGDIAITGTGAYVDLLSFAGTAGKQYLVTADIHGQCGADGMHIDGVVPASALAQLGVFGNSTSTSAFKTELVLADGSGTDIAISSNVYWDNVTGGVLRVTGTVEVQGTGGTIKLRARNVTAGSTATIQTGSKLVAVRKD